ncbi:hypothetical protein CBP52_14485 [Cellulomonas sp. PSBB021]|nr:hypothetical protein CBP52_14485 [Cellulomonas sp. PSBB021]
MTQAATGRKYTDAARLTTTPAYLRARDIARAAYEANLTSAPANITQISEQSFMFTVAGTVWVFAEGVDPQGSVMLEPLNDDDDFRPFPGALFTPDDPRPELPRAWDIIRNAMDRRHSERAAADHRCPGCGDLYRPKNLLPIQEAGPAVCPSCWLSGTGERPGRDVANVAVELDRRMRADLSIDGTWAGLIAFLNVAAASTGTTMNKLFPELLDDASAEFWRTPGDLWIWLPPVANRPDVLPDLDTGACLGALLGNVDERGITLQGVAERAGVSGVDERLWPAVVAYATSFATWTRTASWQPRPPAHERTFGRLRVDANAVSEVLAAFPGTTLRPISTAATLNLAERVAREMFDWDALVHWDHRRSLATDEVERPSPDAPRERTEQP